MKVKKSRPGKFPDYLDIGMLHNYCVEHGLLSQVADQSKLPGETLGRFILPPFQRQAVWTLEQQSRFIESLWLELPISVYCYNESPVQGVADNWLIDGQQRWRSIISFMDDGVVVFGGLHYSDMNERERRNFGNRPFSAMLTRTDDVKFLEKLYYRLAYGGTPHEKPGKMQVR